MGLITGAGVEVAEDISKGRVDLKEAYIRLKKENDSLTVRLLGVDNYVAYRSHNDFKKGIYGTPCIAPMGERCPFCVAKEKGGKEWEGFYAKKRVVFAFACLDTGDIRLLDVSPTQAQKLMADIKEYSEEIIAGEIAFNLTRTGAETSTAYALKPLTPKKFAAIAEQFKQFDGQTVDVQFFADRIVAKSPDYMVKLLANAGFPVAQHFSAELVEKAMAEDAGEAAVTAVDDSGDGEDII